MEVKLDNKWQVFDIDNNCYFPTEYDSMASISFIELNKKLINGQPIKIKYFANDLSLDSQLWNNAQLATMEMKLIATGSRIDWYREVLKVPSVQIGNKNYIIEQVDSTKNNLNKIYKTRLVYLDSLEFCRKFYPEEI